MKLENKNIWVLSNYRNGTNFLCKFLNKVGNYKREFFERFNSHRPSTLQVYYKNYIFKRDYLKWFEGDRQIRRALFFEKVINRGRLPPRMKIMRDQFLEVCGLCDEDKSLIESILPGLKYIHVQRDDLINITVSQYFALKTGYWVLLPEHKERFWKIPVEFDEKEIFQLYLKIKYYVSENSWYQYLSAHNCFDINFQDMVKNPIKIFSELLDFIEVDKKDIDIEKILDEYPFIPTQRPETEEYRGRLKRLVDTSLNSIA